MKKESAKKKRSWLPTATEAREPRSRASGQVAVALAGVWVVMLVAQLFTLEDFLPYVSRVGLPAVGGSTETTAWFVVTTLIVLELLALPFLLRMRLSRAFRWLSVVCGWLVAVFWIAASIWMLQQVGDFQTVGFLGTLVDLVPGWWAVSVAGMMTLAMAWASWGLWPGKQRQP